MINSHSMGMMVLPQPTQPRTFGVPVAEGTLAHVRKTYDAFAGAVHQEMRVHGVARRRGDDFSQLLHVFGLHIHDVEALVAHFQAPQVHAQVVGGNKRLVIAAPPKK